MGVHYKAQNLPFKFCSITTQACFPNPIKKLYSRYSESVKESPCTSDLTYFRHALFVIFNKNHSLQRELPSNQRQSRRESHSVMAYPQVINCNSRSSYQQEIHILPQHEHMFHKNRVQIQQMLSLQRHPSHTYAPIQYTLLDRYIDGSVCKAPAHPPWELLEKTVRYLLFHSPSVETNSISCLKEKFSKLIIPLSSVLTQCTQGSKSFQILYHTTLYWSLKVQAYLTRSITSATSEILSIKRRESHLPFSLIDSQARCHLIFPLSFSLPSCIGKTTLKGAKFTNLPKGVKVSVHYIAFWQGPL